MVLPYINMNPPQVYTCSPSWTPLPPPSPYHSSGSSQCTSPKHPVSCIEPGLATHFIYDIIHVWMPFSQIIPPSHSPTESKRLFYTSVSLLLSWIQGYRKLTSINLLYFWNKSELSSYTHIINIQYCYPSRLGLLASVQKKIMNWLRLSVGEKKKCAYCRTKQDVLAAGASKKQIPKYFQGKYFNGWVRVEHGVCDQYWDILLMAYYWGYWESTSLAV